MWRILDISDSVHLSLNLVIFNFYISPSITFFILSYSQQQDVGFCENNSVILNWHYINLGRKEANQNN